MLLYTLGSTLKHLTIIYMYVHYCMCLVSPDLFQRNYTIDYTTSSNHKLTFLMVFAILFNGCTGIMGMLLVINNSY